MAAHDTVFTDVLPAALDLVAGSLTFTASAGAAGVLTEAAASAVTLTIGTLPPGDGVNLRFAARLTDTVAPGQTVTNTGVVTWTSQPGLTADERHSGGTTYNSNTIADDYELRANAAFTTLTPTVNKLTPAPASYPIGALVTYTVQITLPEGAAQNVVVTDTLPATMGYVTSQVITSAAASGGALSADYAGAVTLAPVVGVAGATVTFAFGTLTTTADDDAANNRLVLQVTARVSNTLANQNGTVLTNTAALRYTNPNTGSPAAVTDPTPAVVSVLEPVLALTKTVLAAPPPVEAGKTIT